MADTSLLLTDIMMRTESWDIAYYYVFGIACDPYICIVESMKRDFEGIKMEVIDVVITIVYAKH